MSRLVVRPAARPTSGTGTSPGSRLLAATLAGLGLAWLAACAQAPATPETKGAAARTDAAQKLPAQYPAAALPGPAASSALAADWWKAYGDEQLNRLIDATLKENADLLAARARIDEAAALLREVGAASLPSVDAAASTSRSQSSLLTATPVPAAARAASSQRAVLTSAFEIDLWGRLAATQSAAQAQWLASQYARDGLSLSLAAQVAQAYVSLRALDAQLALAESATRSRERTRALAERRMQAGVAAALEWHQADAALAEQRFALEDLRRQRLQIEQALALLAASPGLRIDARTPPAGLPPAPTLPARGLPSELLLRRADVRQAEAQLLAAGAQLQATRAAAYPSLSLSASLGGQSAELADLLKSGARVWSLAAALAWPIFDGGRADARSAQAQARREQALAAYLKAAQTAYREAADALAALAANEAQADQAQARLQAAQRADALAERRYAAGLSSLLERLDAERSLLDAQTAALRHQQARLAAGIDLVKALGGGWQPSLAAQEASRR